MNIGISHALGKVIRRLRQQKQLSQEMLAEQSGLHVNTLHLLEKGANEAKISTVLFIAKGLEIKPEKLVELWLQEYYKK